MSPTPTSKNILCVVFPTKRKRSQTTKVYLKYASSTTIEMRNANSCNKPLASALGAQPSGDRLDQHLQSSIAQQYASRLVQHSLPTYFGFSRSLTYRGITFTSWAFCPNNILFPPSIHIFHFRRLLKGPLAEEYVAFLGSTALTCSYDGSSSIASGEMLDRILQLLLRQSSHFNRIVFPCWLSVIMADRKNFLHVHEKRPVAFDTAFHSFQAGFLGSLRLFIWRFRWWR